MKPHKHAELIKAWADGHTIERLWNDYKGNSKGWLIDNEPDWSEFEEYRIKPEPKPDIEYFYEFMRHGQGIKTIESNRANLKLIYDGETEKLKSAEVLK